MVKKEIKYLTAYEYNEDEKSRNNLRPIKRNHINAYYFKVKMNICSHLEAKVYGINISI